MHTGHNRNSYLDTSKSNQAIIKVIIQFLIQFPRICIFLHYPYLYCFTPIFSLVCLIYLISFLSWIVDDICMTMKLYSIPTTSNSSEFLFWFLFYGWVVVAHPDSSSIFTRPIPALLIHRCGETTNTNPNQKSEFSLSFHCFPVIFFVHFNSVNSWLISLRKRILLLVSDTSTVLSAFQSQCRLSIIPNCQMWICYLQYFS